MSHTDVYTAVATAADWVDTFPLDLRPVGEARAYFVRMATGAIEALNALDVEYSQEVTVHKGAYIVDEKTSRPAIAVESRRCNRSNATRASAWVCIFTQDNRVQYRIECTGLPPNTYYPLANQALRTATDVDAAVAGFTELIMAVVHATRTRNIRHQGKPAAR